MYATLCVSTGFIVLNITAEPHCHLLTSFSPHLHLPSFYSLSISSTDISKTNFKLYLTGFIFTVVVFPIGLVLLILSCYDLLCKKSGTQYQKYYNCPHKSTSKKLYNLYPACVARCSIDRYIKFKILIDPERSSMMVWLLSCAIFQIQFTYQ